MTDAAAATQQGGGQGGGNSQQNGGMTATFVPSGGGDGGSSQQGGGGNKDWLPQEYRTDPTFRDISDIGAMAKMFKEGQRLIGTKALAKPGQGASAEDMAAWRKLLGVPEKPDGYKMPEIKGFENVDYPVEEMQKNINKYAAKLHELGAPPEVVEGLMNFYLEDAKGMIAAMQTDKNKKVDADDAAFAQMTTKAYGADAAKKVAQGQALLATYLPAEMADTVKGFNNDQLFAVLSLVNNIAGKHISEDQMPKTSAADTRGGQASDADRLKLQSDRMELMKDPYKNRVEIEAINKKIASAYGRA